MSAPTNSCGIIDEFNSSEFGKLDIVVLLPIDDSVVGPALEGMYLALSKAFLGLLVINVLVSLSAEFISLLIKISLFAVNNELLFVLLG